MEENSWREAQVAFPLLIGLSNVLPICPRLSSIRPPHYWNPGFTHGKSWGAGLHLFLDLLSPMQLYSWRKFFSVWVLMESTAPPHPRLNCISFCPERKREKLQGVQTPHWTHVVTSAKEQVEFPPGMPNASLGAVGFSRKPCSGHLGLNQCRAPFWVTIRDIQEERFSMARFQTWDPYRALDPCLFDLALNLRGTTNVIGRIFSGQKNSCFSVL